MKARPAVLLFLCVFLALASIGLARSEEEKSKLRLCAKRCALQNDATRYLACHSRCKLTKPWDEKKEAAEKDPRLPEPKEGEEKEEDEEQKEQEEEERGEQQEQEEEEKQQQQENPYYLPSDQFQTRFENEFGQIRVLKRFDKLSPHLQMLRYYRIVQFSSRPGTLIVPHHSDAEYLVINTRGRALVTIVLQNYKEYFNLNQFDVLRVPAGAICYTINQANDQDLELLKLALPVNIPGEFENFYPSGTHIPTSYYKAFDKKTLQAALNAPYEEIQNVLLGSEEEEEQGQGSEEGVILKLQRQQLRSLLRRAQSSLSRQQKESSLGPFNLKNVEARYFNDHGSFHEAHPHKYPPLQDIGIGISHLKLSQGSLFMPHYNTRAIILAFVVNGEGHAEIACPHLANQQQEGEGKGQEQEQDHKEGQIKSLSAKVSKDDLYVIPAGHPVAVRASKNSNLEVVEFVLNSPYNFRNFLAGKKENVVNKIDREVKDAAFEGSGEQVERLFNRQRESYFVDREEQPSGGGKSPRQANRVAWSSFLTAFV